METQARLVPRFDAPATKGEPRALTVSVWFGFAPIIADVVVESPEGAVYIVAAWIRYQDRDPIVIRASELDLLAVVRTTGPVPLRAAIERRAREEAFA